MNYENDFDDQLRRVSGKNILVKCNPLKFSLYYEGSFQDTKHKTLDSIIENQYRAIATNNHSINTYTQDDILIQKLNNTTSQTVFKTALIDELKTIFTPRYPLLSFKQSKIAVTFSRLSNIHWDVYFMLVSSEYVCLSMESEGSTVKLYYVNQLDEIKTITVKQSVITFLGFVPQKKLSKPV